MADFRIDTGWSIFDIYLKNHGEGDWNYSIQYGDDDTLLLMTESERGEIESMELIYVDRIRQEDIVLPDRESVSERFFPLSPDDEDEHTRSPLWVNLHPLKKELEMIFLPPKWSLVRADCCYREDRVEIYYGKYSEYNADTDSVEDIAYLACIKVLDLTDQEYAYLKQFT